MKKKLLAAILMFAVLLSNLTFASAANDYMDVPEDAWFYDSVDFITEEGLMNGTGSDLFSPYEKLTRAMFVTILHRLAGEEPAKSASGQFSDVPEDSYYYEAVYWAVEQGISNGTGETSFTPSASITRQDMACMIARYSQSLGLQFKDIPFYGYYPDTDDVSSYAAESVRWVGKYGLMLGDPDGSFRPKDTTTRAEAATVCMRLVGSVLLAKEDHSRAVLRLLDHKTADPGALYVLSERDTSALRTILTNKGWNNIGTYAEFIPTQVLWLDGVRYHFNIADPANPPLGFNKMAHDAGLGDNTYLTDQAGSLMAQCVEILFRYCG